MSDAKIRAAAEQARAALQSAIRKHDEDGEPLRSEVYDARDILRDALRALAEQPQPVAKAVATAPERIWLQISDDASDLDEPWPEDAWPDATWCWHSTTDAEVEYVRADLVAPPPSAAQPEAQPTVVRIVSYGPENRYGYRYDPDDPATLIAPGEALAIVKWPPSAPEPSEVTDEMVERVRLDLYALSGGDFDATPGEARATIASVMRAAAAARNINPA